MGWLPGAAHETISIHVFLLLRRSDIRFLSALVQSPRRSILGHFRRKALSSVKQIAEKFDGPLAAAGDNRRGQ